AMEFIHGVTLTRWLKQRERGWRNQLEPFIQAGRGLAAAHQAGLVHRDFKPDNVMVGNDDRVCVTDFGLAHAGKPPAEENAAHQNAVALSVGLSGAVAGTPAYMAPEQHSGQATDARADQFSFCVALYEGLYGERPFGGESTGQLATAVARHEVRSAPAGSRVP